MLRDVFYYGAKPNVHPREQFAENLEDARQKCSTEHFWIINEFCDYRNFDWNFDFEFLPDEDVWAEDHNNVWPSQHQKDSGTWLCPKEHSDLIIYRGDVDPIIRKNEKQSDNWVELDLIDHTKFDFSWHPDPSDPPYIYKWGCKFFPAELKHVLEYVVPGATQEKYMTTTVELLPQTDLWVELQPIDKHKFDMSWRPDPMDPPFIYIWGNKYIDGKLKSTLEYHVPGAADKKYMPEKLEVLPEWDKWVEVQAVDKTKFDFTWRPDPREPAYIYTWGNEYIDAELKATLEYHCEGATERKYMTNDVAVIPEWDKWVEVQAVDKTKFDFTWRPDPREPAYIYTWGNKFIDGDLKPTLEYHCEGATERKYMTNDVIVLPEWDKWVEVQAVDKTKFDFTWRPDPREPAYIYTWGNEYISGDLKPTLEYHCEGATDRKYMTNDVIVLPEWDRWVEVQAVDKTKFDFTWRPDPREPAYIYTWGNKFIDSELKATLEYHCEGATERKYMTNDVAVLPEWDKWVEVQAVDKSKFDFTWRPDPREPAYIYTWGNKFIDAELKATLEYHCEGAIERKYMTNDVAVLPEQGKWKIVENIVPDSFDLTWRPDPREPALIYVFGNQYYDAIKMPTVEYHCEGATERKFMDNMVAQIAPNPKLYEHLEDAQLEDYSWLPDPDSPPYIYVWGNQWNAPEDKISVQFVVPGATEYKYMSARAIRKPCMDNWIVPDNINTAGFDFSWEPSPAAPPYIYEFGTQWQKTGGPQYVVPGATEKQYVDFQKVKKLPSRENWTIPDNVDITGFDFSWHPDDTSPPYVYVFATQWAFSGGPIYTVDGATETKYVDDQVAITKKDMTNWVYDPDLIDVETFDFSWHPYVEDQPYIYEFGTQWQKTGGPKYITPGADSSSPTKYIDTRILHATRLPNQYDKHWKVLNNYKIKDFDWSWHPDTTEEPYIYVFGNTQYAAEECPTIEYRVPGATKVKYISDVVATLDVSMTAWEIPDDIEVDDFDFSWIPKPNDPPYIYEFGTQWQKTGGPKYVVKGATETKYLDTHKVTRLADTSNWDIPDYVDRDSFDFSWHPDDTDPPYIYQFGTQWALSGGPKYVVEGATEVKYMDEQTAKAVPNKTNWEFDETLLDVDSFDFSWHPYVDDQPYIYQFGTQWQKTGGPRYITPGATSNSPVKYVDTRIIKAKRLPVKSSNWKVLDYEIENFDFSWHPDDTEEPYIYVFGSNLYPAEEMPTVTYTVEGAEQYKYMPNIVAKLAPNKNNWKINIPIDESKWDFTWVPNPTDPAYIYAWGDQHYSAEIDPVIEYVVPGATETKYMHNVVATTLPNKSKFKFLHPIIEDGFDFSWRPNPNDPPYIYVFGNNQYPAEIMPTVEYKVKGATEIKYVQDVIVTLAPNKANWKIVEDIVEDSFDFSWVPNPNDPPYIYVFGNTQYPGTIYPTVEYHVRGAKDKKYVDDIVAELKPNPENFTILHPIVKGSFDFSWRPNPTDPPYIYVFGNNQYSAEEMPTVEYKVKGAVEYKYVTDIVATLGNNMSNWEVPDNIDSSFDFSWVPHPSAPPYIYEFATVWNNRGGPKYVVPGATEYKYIEDIKAKTLPNRKNWEIPEGVDVSKFDFSWVPHPQAPPYIYQFGTLTNTTDGPRYITPDNNGEVVYLERVESDGPIVAEYYIETTLEDLVKEHPEEVFWAKRKNIDYSEFNFSWRPESLKDLDYVQVFGSAESESTQTYFVNATNFLLGKTDFKFIETVSLNEETLSQIFIKPDMFYVDKGNADAAERFEKLKAIFGNKIQKTRYLNSWVDTVNRCINRSTTELLWVLNSELDYTNFDFDYYPNPWQMKMVHVFGTQWSHWGTTFMVNREAFPEDTKYIKIIEHLSMLNFVKDRRAVATDCVYDIVVIDHGNDETDKVVELLQQKAPTKNVTVVKYNESYLNTIRSLVNRLPEKKEHYLWLCSSVCDYSKFDFSYICDPFARDNLHVFPSGKQKFGDTFLIDVNKTKEIIGELESLEDYQKVNYNGTIKTERLPAPEIVTSSDTLIDAVKKSLTRNFPYAVIMTEDNVDLPETEYEPINLWAPDTKNIIITSTGATRIIAPFEASENIDKEIYDYPYIKRAAKLAKSNPLDIVFVSNGETVAEQNYEHLLSVTQGLSNKIHRVDGINGRTEALHAAAESSKTPWFFCVPAKLFVNKKFDWNYQADRLQMPKHYIFNAHNPVNELFYGHQSMVLYNKNLVLGNKGVGLDFTLDSPHMSVELNSGIVVGDTDEHSTWRTAFREAVKLKKYSDNGDETSKERLAIWTTVGKGNYGEWSVKGALDGIEFYNEVEGDLAKLRQSYYWDWLQDRFNSKY